MDQSFAQAVSSQTHPRHLSGPAINGSWRRLWRYLETRGSLIFHIAAPFKNGSEAHLLTRSFGNVFRQRASSSNLFLIRDNVYIAIGMRYNARQYEDRKALAPWRDRTRPGTALCLPDDRRVGRARTREAQDDPTRRRRQLPALFLCSCTAGARNRQEVRWMVTKNRPSKLRTRRSRWKQMFDAGRVPPTWRRRLMAGVAICTGVTTLARNAHRKDSKGGSDDDSS